MASRRAQFSAIDLFSGCGGLSLGLRWAGFKVVAAIDNDSVSTATYRMNHRRTRLIEEDIRSVDPEVLMKELGLNPEALDLLAGCPPCQGFSTLRTLNGGRGVLEPMNDLVFEFPRFVQVFLPKAIMMENVPTLLNDARLGKIKEELGDLGYGCDADIFNAEKYGVPQRRRRMIFLAFRPGCPSFASPARRRRTVAAAIRRLPLPEQSNDLLHNYSVRRSDRITALIRRIPQNGGSRTALPTEDQLNCHQDFDGFKDIYGRMAWRTPAPTITTGCINPSKGRFVHPEQDRAITLREAALLQGFPKSYAFATDQGRYPTARIIGNAFPPKFAEHHARRVYEHLSRLLAMDNRSHP